MALTDDDATTVEHSFCSSCGQAAGTGRFCSNCGAAISTRMPAPGNSTLTSNSTGTGGAVPPPTLTTSTTAPPAKPRRNSRLLLIALGALGLVAVAVAAVILTTRGDSAPKPKRVAGPSASAVYRNKLQAALSPLISSNQRMSNAVDSVNPSNPNVNSAKSAAGATQTAVATARGAASAVSAPAADRTLSQQVQQALDNENGYVQAVVATLANPRSSQAGQLQTLATSLQSSLVPIDPVVSGASPSVSGTNRLTSWANAAPARQRKAAAKHQRSSSSSSSSGSSSSSASTGSSAVSSDPYANGANCGNGVYAGPNTSCPFAENVYQAWLNSTGGDTVVVQAYSPVTNESYAMDCAPAGAGITCTGGNSASVSWSLG